jgi:hypothetical protein
VKLKLLKLRAILTSNVQSQTVPDISSIECPKRNKTDKIMEQKANPNENESNAWESAKEATITWIPNCGLFFAENI